MADRKPKPLSDPARFRLAWAIPLDLATADDELDFLRDTDLATKQDVQQKAQALFALALEALGGGAVRLLRTARDLGELFRGDPEVVTLIAHSPTGQDVELLERDVAFGELLEQVPEGFAGMLDLRVCHAESGWADEVRARRGCSVRAADGELDFRVVGWAYSRTLQLVFGKGLPYDEAARAAWAELSVMASTSRS